MASEYSDLPQLLATRTGEAYQSNFSTRDYGRVGDQRPYQIVFPGYPAPKWLQRFNYLNEALRECGTLCQLTGQPFRLMKWGSRVPCYPCGARKRTNELPGLKIRSTGAVAGFPSARPIADFNPATGVILYDKRGRPRFVGKPNFKVTRSPASPTKNFVNWDTPLPVRYEEAVKTAQIIANRTGQTAYICSSFGAGCKRPNNAAGMAWRPMVYVQPGGLVRRYPADLKLPSAASVPGSETAVTRVTEDEFRELVRESAGRSRLGQGH